MRWKPKQINAIACKLFGGDAFGLATAFGSILRYGCFVRAVPEQSQAPKSMRIGEQLVVKNAAFHFQLASTPGKTFASVQPMHSMLCSRKSLNFQSEAMLRKTLKQ